MSLVLCIYDPGQHWSYFFLPAEFLPGVIKVITFFSHPQYFINNVYHIGADKMAAV